MRKHNPDFLSNVWPLKLWKHKHLVGISEEQKNNVYKNGDKIAIFHVF